MSLLDDDGLPVLPEALLNAPIRFGLREQGHLPTIRRMLDEGRTWREIGRAINWCPDTAREWFEREPIEPECGVR